MREIIRLIVLLLVVAGLGIYFHIQLQKSSSPSVAEFGIRIPHLFTAPFSITSAYAYGSSTPLIKKYGPYSVQGSVILDASSGVPAVPYIIYKNDIGRTFTKQLIFQDQRGCLPTAVDYPCVPSYDQLGAYPQLTTGERITVQGYFFENRFLVDTLSVDK